ncbi:MAG: hypothetical protein KGK17_06435 [Betaproteobacteria bacterium]|nr:hypothetical protein [Betaproteobacteria bacterium]
MANTVTSSSTVARFAGALYGIALDNATMQAVLAGANAQGMDAYLDGLYANTLGNTSAATVAQTIASNMGLTGALLSDAETYLTGILNTTAPSARGAVIEGILNQFALTTDPAVVSATAAWEAVVAQSLIYSENATFTANIPLQELSSVLSTTYTLTPGVDHIVVANNNAVINGIGQGNGTPIPGVQATFNTGDTLSGGTTTGNTLNLTDAANGGYWNPTAVSGASVSDIQHVNLVSGEAVIFAPVASFMGYTGLSDVNITSVSNQYHVNDIVVDKNTAVVVNDQAQAGLGSAQYGGYGMVVAGGSTVAITEANGSGYGNDQHAILVNGGPGTTQVSVTQTEAAPNGFQQGVVINDNNGTIQSVSVNGLDNFTWSAVVNYGSGYGYGGYGYGYSTIRQFNGGDLKINNATALTHLTLNNMVDGAYANVRSATALTDLTLENVSGGATVNLYNQYGHASTLNLALVAVSGVINIFDQVSIYKTLNVSTSGNASLNYTVAPTVALNNLQTLNVSGTGVLSLTQPLQFPTQLQQVAITGTAGFDGDLSNAGRGTTVIDASRSSGAVTLWVDGTHQQVFMGGTGPTIVTLNGNATEAITGGPGSSNEVVLNYALGGAPSAQTEAQVTGFGTLGVTGAIGSGAQTIDVAGFAGDTIHTLEVFNGATSGSLTFARVAPGTVLQVDTGDAQTLLYQTSDIGGPNDSVTVVLGTAGAPGNVQTHALTLQDGVAQGIGTVALDTQGLAGSSQTVGQLTDLNLADLSISGPQPLIVSALTDQATVLTVTDSAQGNSAIHALNAANLTTATFTQTGTGVLTVGDTSQTSTQIATLNLSGNVALTLSGDAVSSGVTVNGAGDSQGVTLDLVNGAAAGHMDQITLGNGSNQVTDGSAQGQVNITVGTGTNQITLTGAGVNGTITLGTHGVGTTDQIAVGAVGYTGNLAQVTIAGYNPNTDHLQFTADPQAGSPVVTTVSASTLSAYATTNGLDINQLSTWVNGTLASSGLGLSTHDVAAFQFQGDTYLVEQAGTLGSLFGAGDTLVKLSGLLTF